MKERNRPMKYRAVLKFYDESGLTKTVPVPDAKWRSAREQAVDDLVQFVLSGETVDVPEKWSPAGNDVQKRSN